MFNDILAPFISRFKASSPQLFLFIQLFLMASLFVINNGVDIGAFETGPLIDAIGEWINYVLIALTAAVGSRTTRYINMPPRTEGKAAA